MKKLLLILSASAVGATAIQAQFSSNFDMDTVGDAPSVWGLNPSGGTLVVSSAYAQSGSNSLMIDSTGAGAWSSPNAFQTFPATAGTEYSFSGYMLMPSSAPITDASFGLLKIEFYDGGGTRLDVAGNVTIGGAAASPFFGAESTPFINNASVVDTWIFTETKAFAPVGTVEASFFLLNVNQGEAPSPVYFDSIVAVPEPATFALFGGLLALGVVFYRRRRKA